MNKAELLLNQIDELLSSNSELDTFSYDGYNYSASKLRQLAANYPTRNFAIKDLLGVLKDTHPLRNEPQRIFAANLNEPVLITRYQNKWVVLDGLLTIKKAQLQNRSTVNVKQVTQQDLDKVKIGKVR